VEVSKKSIEQFFDEVATELGIDTEGGRALHADEH
jgi:hypothetical protein